MTDRETTPESSEIEPGGELRFSRLTGRWVVVAPSRGRRPVRTGAHDRIEDGAPTDERSGRPRQDQAPEPSCPFCPGNEETVPPIAWELRGPYAAGWSVRAVPNRYPAFARSRESQPHHPARPAEGYQEVLVESPLHLDDLCEMRDEELEQVVEGYRNRYAELASRPGIARVILFRNRGPRAGTSLRHPHAQLVATALDPPVVRERESAFRRLRRELRDECPLCDPSILEPELDARLLHEGEHFRAWVPWAAETPWEIRIAPRRHTPDFGALAEAESRALARLLGRLTRAYRDVAGDPDYNLLVHSAGPTDPDPDDLHWWISLRPRVGTDAGLELLTGVRVNPSLPDSDARVLRRGLDRE